MERDIIDMLAKYVINEKRMLISIISAKKVKNIEKIEKVHLFKYQNCIFSYSFIS